MSTGIMVVGVSTRLLLGALLAAVSGKDVFVVVEVVVLVLVEVSLRHDYRLTITSSFFFVV